MNLQFPSLGLASRRGFIASAVGLAVSGCRAFRVPSAEARLSSAAALARQQLAEGAMRGVSEHVAADGRTFIVAVNCCNEDRTFELKIDGRLGKVWRGSFDGTALKLAGLDAAVFEVL